MLTEAFGSLMNAAAQLYWEMIKPVSGSNDPTMISRGINIPGRGGVNVPKGLGKNFSKISDDLLKKSGIDAHQLKKDFLGNKAKISQYDLYKDTKTGEILILQKGGKGAPIQTGEFIK